MKKIFSKFVKEFPQIITGEPLNKLTSIRIGGPADLYVKMDENGNLMELISAAKKCGINYMVLGGGTNVIFHQDGFRGLIIHMKAANISVSETRITAEAGALLSQVVLAAKKHSLSGMEAFMGLPGTIGGAVRGNAGANGREIKDIIDEATVYTNSGIKKFKKADFGFGYRTSCLKSPSHKEYIILDATLNLQRVKSEQIAKLTEEAVKNIAARNARQPKGFSSGSFFKNPSPDKPAGKLLEMAGCKGLSYGEAVFSEKHANWIINRGSATQDDILNLARMARHKVKEQFGINLEAEAQLVGIEGFIDL